VAGRAEGSVFVADVVGATGLDSEVMRRYRYWCERTNVSPPFGSARGQRPSGQVWIGIGSDQGEQGCLGLGAASVGKARAGRPAGVDARRVVRRLRVPEAVHGRLPAVVHRCGVDHGGGIVTLIYSMPVNDV
jgi:hypothetical protein